MDVMPLMLSRIFGTLQQNLRNIRKPTRDWASNFTKNCADVGLEIVDRSNNQKLWLLETIHIRKTQLGLNTHGEFRSRELNLKKIVAK